MLRHTLAVAAVSVGALAATQAATSAATTTPLLTRLTHVSNVGSTVSGNGDVNPYGIVKVNATVGALQAGDLLISNFNDKANQQGTGTTIVEVSPSGHRSVFAHVTDPTLPGSCPGGVGLTTALDVLPGGYVVVGSLPTSDGTSATAQAGCLIVLDRTGKPVSTISGPMIQGPWDSTVVSKGSTSTLFVSMALVGGAAAGTHTVDNSTVVRIGLDSSRGHAPTVTNETVIADKIPRRDDPNALVIGPTGLALGSGGQLYVADTLDSRIASVPNAMTRTSPATDAGATVSMGGHLNQPLGLTVAPNGDVIAANAGDGNMVEVSAGGHQVATRTVDTKTGAGSLFGLLVAPSGKRIYFVDDGDNTLKVLH
jgi:sugar lactone lactonase YvrE